MSNSNKKNQTVQEKINELCWRVFNQSADGQELLRLWELKHFRSPVAFPNKEPSWAYFNEGQNEFLRGITLSIQTHMNPPKTSTEKRKVRQ